MHNRCYKDCLPVLANGWTAMSAGIWSVDIASSGTAYTMIYNEYTSYIDCVFYSDMYPMPYTLAQAKFKVKIYSSGQTLGGSLPLSSNSVSPSLTPLEVKVMSRSSRRSEASPHQLVFLRCQSFSEKKREA